jgi:hypothetical protein
VLDRFFGVCPNKIQMQIAKGDLGGCMVWAMAKGWMQGLGNFDWLCWFCWMLQGLGHASKV